jgi:alkaline phosphatase
MRHSIIRAFAITFSSAFLLPAALIFFTQCNTSKRTTPQWVPPQAAVAKNIILLIGDGMALSQVSANVYWQNGLDNSVFSRFPYCGFHQSHAADDLVTDSAAGATAFACGHKTENGAIGVVPPNDDACSSLLEEWAFLGKGTGIVTSCSATHATPASFIAHRNSRAFTEQIALDYLKTPFDCLIAGGEHYFSTERPDQLNLKDSLRQRGYVVRSGTSFNRLPLDGSAPFVLFTHEREPPTASGGRSYLPKATRVACDFLSKRRPEGFFLMVEGSQIDWGCHANDRNWVKVEMQDFDRTVTEALNFAAVNGETLVVVTGDHECGGFALNVSDAKRSFKPAFCSRYHTSAMVPVFAFGPGAALFSGIYENTAIYEKMKAAATKK